MSYKFKEVASHVVLIEFTGNIGASEMASMFSEISKFTLDLGYTHKGYVKIFDMTNASILEFDVHSLVSNAPSPLADAIVVMHNNNKPLILNLLKVVFSITRQKIYHTSTFEEALEKAQQHLTVMGV